MKILLKNITVVNPDGIQPEMDILIDGGIFQSVGKNIVDTDADLTVDTHGLHAFPGLCDLHSHLRDPGQTAKEDIVTGTKSAATGGYTAVCCMPNTKPVTDSVKTIRYIKDKADEDGYCEVFPVACITKGMKGKALTDFAALCEAGAVAFSDDGKPVETDEMINAAMERAKEMGLLLMLHEEDLKQREQGGGVANEGPNAEKAGLAGIPNAIEDAMTARDIFYAMQKGAKIHICHVSTAGSVELVRRAKQNGVQVTCETAPHYFSLTDEAVLDGDPNAKMNPPLRSEADRAAVIEGLRDGTIDVIATDHAPHTPREKAKGFKHAPFGIIGFETAFPLVVTRLYRAGLLKLEDIARLMAGRPREIIGTAGGYIKEGASANIMLANLESSYRYEKSGIVSKAENSPFIGWELYGKVLMTINKGRVTYDRSSD